MDKEAKWCPRCQQHYSRDNFYRNVTHSSGLSSHCKQCHLAACQARQARLRERIQDKPHVQQGEETKRCSRCQEVKSVSDFYKSKQWIDGLHVYCKKCILAYQKEKHELKLEQSPGKYRWKRDLIRHDYFAQIDSPIKAYVLGILAADGNILAKHDRITLELSAKDAGLLETVRDELVPGGTISTRSRRGYDYQILVFVSHPMVVDLAELGITPAKSRIIVWPEKLPHAFAREFILGYFDGDGFITYHERPNRRYPYLGFTSGSRDLLVSIADIIEQHTGCRPGGPWNKDKSNGYVIRACGNDAHTIDKWLHESGLGLQRKRLL
ncbi:MAG: LAGLIDADG family homing endonuclease [Chloroflexi bacterium]|nr:LAGLIDADG family homing endonuclease [Chloroflexota bacterium]